ncbi:synaptic plasticity regulator PANTS-like [Artemia franciscana]|uniref:Synaptic plasticity regulator PANTS n=1 Tax=Artemia franciscana TaxID=6661 RepID=A0AA88HAL5_ARTSF|nr:hypothetical protein QYM36_014724 [Artemia franciscana]
MDESNKEEGNRVIEEKEHGQSNNENKAQASPYINFQTSIRRPHEYKDEYNECRSIRGRFHQYFILGETTDCSKWKEDYANSERWETLKDTEALEKVMQNERERIRQRLNPHYNNPVWKPRKDTPADWNAPLPDYLTRNHEGSLLKQYSAELKGEQPPIPLLPPTSFCSIM